MYAIRSYYESFVTDEGFRMAKSPLTFCCIYGGEDFDGRLLQSGYTTADFQENDSWQKVEIVEPPKGRLRSQMQPPVKVMQTYESYNFV